MNARDRDEERDNNITSSDMMILDDFVHKNEEEDDLTSRVDDSDSGFNIVKDYDERNERNTSNDNNKINNNINNSIDISATPSTALDKNPSNENRHERNLSDVELMESFWTSTGSTSASIDYNNISSIGVSSNNSNKKIIEHNNDMNSSSQFGNWDNVTVGNNNNSNIITSPATIKRESVSSRASIVLPTLTPTTSSTYMDSSNISDDINNSESLNDTMIMSSNNMNNVSRRQSMDEEEGTLSSKLHDEARITNWSSVLHLCKTSPHLAKYTGPDRWTALHHACNRRPPASVVEALLRAHPDALLEQDQKGWTPLHHACRFKACLDVVRLLLTFYPRLGRRAAGRRGNRGRTALYYAIRYDAPEGVVEMLLDVDSSVVLEKDRAGESPLSLIWDSFAASCSGRKAIQACLVSSGRENNDVNNGNSSMLPAGSKVHERWEKVNLLLRSAFQPNNHGENNSFAVSWRILHAICSISSSCHHTLFDVARAMHPQQIYTRDEITGYTALHCAVTSQSSCHVIQTLVNDYPDAASIYEYELHQLPLHIAAESDKKKKHWVNDGLECIYLAYPDAVTKQDLYGRLPLHLSIISMLSSSTSTASSRNASSSSNEASSTSVINNLIDICPEGATQTQNDGKLPLHLIAQHAEEWNIECDAIYEAYPNAIKVPYSSQRLLPLHIASISPDAKPSIMQQLLHYYPQAISILDIQGRLPIHLACDAGKTWENALSILYEAYPSSIYIQCQTNQFTPLHYATYSPNTSNETIITLLNLDTKFSTTTNATKNATILHDKHNRLPLHLSCMSGKSYENVILPILNAYPTAIYEVDLHNCLPFHLAALYNTATTTTTTITDEAYLENNEKDNNDSNDIIPMQQDIDKINTLYQLLLFSPSCLLSNATTYLEKNM